MNKIFICLLIMAGVLTGCTRYDNPQPNFEDHELPVDDGLIERKVLIITVDGLVGLELQKGVPTNLSAMLQNSKYSFQGIADKNTSDPASWATLITGVNASRHRIINDSYIPAPDPYNPHKETPLAPSFLYMIKQQNKRMSTTVVTQSRELSYVLLLDATERLVEENDEAVKNAAVEQLKNSNLDLILTQFTGVLDAGKSSSFSYDSPEYRSAIEQVDAHIGALKAAVEARPTYEKEDWLIIVTSTHGASGNSYGGDSLEERNIFMAYYNDNFQSQELRPEIMSTVRFWGHSTLSQGLRATNSEPGASDYFNIGSNGELTFEVVYSWAPVKTVAWSGNYTELGDQTFWYSALASKKYSTNTASVGWGFYTWNTNIALSVSDGVNGVNIQTSRSNGTWSVLTGRIKKLADGSAEISLFNNGNLVESQIIENFDFAKANTQPLALGYGNTVSYELPDFRLATFRVWKKALTDREILENSCKGALEEGDLSLNNLIGEWNVKNGNANGISNSVDGAFDLHYEGSAPTYLLEQLYTPCESDPSAVLVQSLDLPAQVLYWLELDINDDLQLEGSNFLKGFEIEFIK